MAHLSVQAAQSRKAVMDGHEQSVFGQTPAPPVIQQSFFSLSKLPSINRDMGSFQISFIRVELLHSIQNSHFQFGASSGSHLSHKNQVESTNIQCIKIDALRCYL